MDEQTATKICPDCAETIKAQAHVCRFCGYRFEPVHAGAAGPIQTPASRRSNRVATLRYLRRNSREWHREMASAGGWRWLLDVPGSPAVPVLISGMAALGFNGVGGKMTGSQKARGALVGWAFFGGFGTLVLWMAWFFFRMVFLLTAIGIGVAWTLYAVPCYGWRRRRMATPPSPTV